MCCASLRVFSLPLRSAFHRIKRRESSASSRRSGREEGVDRCGVAGEVNVWADASTPHAVAAYVFFRVEACRKCEGLFSLLIRSERVSSKQRDDVGGDDMPRV